MIGAKSLVGAPFLLLGLVFVGASAVRTWEVNALAVTGAHTLGEVSSMTRKSNNARRGGRSWHAGVVFKTAAGAEIGFVNRQGSALRSFDKGEIVEVAYDPANPENAIINNFWTRSASVFDALFASIFVALGGWLIRRDRREAKETGWGR
ncbi:hypothetical protein GCM10023115_02170 [Pontixanthobacter gangjinensis]|uniref:DUF3592 domain-containing protein n=1 Tax=Pontixanthobacter gangjinensis TaxID=1028742 RepID=A0A6I4SK12_9SPHN|nr:DUF3592 domain-containing protein [Pontixanthobacter gangjinensis]MXO55470.1 DUF3592 domain-containing protein [Pontixanthobacter gangjinensis]